MYITKRIKKQKIKIFVKNNKSKTTILFIHGFSSSNEFAKDLFTLQNKYNIVSIDLYQEDNQKDMNFNNMINVAKGVLSKLRSKNIILLGHSLGGGIIAKLHDYANVRHVIWLSTINPEMVNNVLFQALRAHHSDKGSMIIKMITNQISNKTALAKEDSPKKWMNKFLDQESAWVDIFQQTIFNDDYMLFLEEAYLKSVGKSTHIIGEKDFVINTESFCKFIKRISGKPIIIGKGHNPIVTNPKSINNLLNDLVVTEQQKFKRPIFKLLK